MLVIVPNDIWSWIQNRRNKVSWRAYAILAVHVFLALAYTTPWDNYLVATGVWWYEPHLVTGYTVGWVPLEEYIFFILQTTLTGLWALYVHNRFDEKQINFLPNIRQRVVSSLLILGLWFISFGILVFSWTPGTYLALILLWALLPILVQVSFGADILIKRLQTLALTILPPTFYLWIVDYIAIQSGTWTIDSLQTTGIRLALLPLEEMLFFLVTNLIIGFGIHLMLATESQARARNWLARFYGYAHGSRDDATKVMTPRNQPRGERS